MRHSYRIVLIALAMILETTNVMAQRNANFINVSAGANFRRGLEATISYEHGTKYHNAWEYFGTYHVTYDEDPICGHITKDSFWKSYNTWHIGVAYKPCVSRRRNCHGNLRIGASAGSNRYRFLGAVHIGYEYSFSLYHGWELFFQFKEDLLIPKRNSELFRTGAAFGVKIPLN